MVRAPDPFCVLEAFSVYTAAVSRVPPHATGSAPDPGGADHVEELGDDAIIAEEMGAHAPKPRARVMEESRSIVISEPVRPPSAANPNVLTDSGPRKRSERTEKTVVIRERRQIDELRREIEKRKSTSQPPRSRGLLLWVIVGVGAFLVGGLAAIFAGRDEQRPLVPAAGSVSGALLPPPAPTESAEPPSISIDALPIEGEKK